MPSAPSTNGSLTYKAYVDKSLVEVPRNSLRDDLASAIENSTFTPTVPGLWNDNLATTIVKDLCAATFSRCGKRLWVDSDTNTDEYVSLPRNAFETVLKSTMLNEGFRPLEDANFIAGLSKVATKSADLSATIWAKMCPVPTMAPPSIPPHREIPPPPPPAPGSAVTDEQMAQQLSNLGATVAKMTKDIGDSLGSIQSVLRQLIGNGPSGYGTSVAPSGAPSNGSFAPFPGNPPPGFGPVTTSTVPPDAGWTHVTATDVQSQDPQAYSAFESKMHLPGHGRPPQDMTENVSSAPTYPRRVDFSPQISGPPTNSGTGMTSGAPSMTHVPPMSNGQHTSYGGSQAPSQVQPFMSVATAA